MLHAQWEIGTYCTHESQGQSNKEQPLNNSYGPLARQ